jgi:hypothetical protein
MQNIKEKFQLNLADVNIEKCQKVLIPATFIHSDIDELIKS